MAGPTDPQLKLIRDYEPALYFFGNPEAAGAERFFPSNARSYLEKAALRGGATSDVWNPPIIEAGRISATEGAGGPGAVFFGERDSMGVPLYLTKPGYFLDASGWKSGDQYADLDRLAARYTPGGDLGDSRFCYHAEFFDSTRLKRLFDDAVDPGGGVIQFGGLLQPQAGQPAFLTDPALICYYLFYPGHEESLSGCTDPETGVLHDKARDFGSYTGEWSCIAILLDRAGLGQDYAPKYVGLTNRNAGPTKVGDAEVRSTMRVLPWSAMQTFAGNHPRFKVAKGTHALYVPDETVPAITLDDPSAAFCGSAGPLPFPPNQYGHDPLAPVAAFYKFIAGAAAGSVLGFPGALIGLGAGLIWGISELESTDHLTHINVQVPPSVAPTVDAVPSPGDFVICPVGARPIDASGQVVEWKSGVAVPVDDFTVDRAEQVLWGDDPDGAGFTGRWGQLVKDDPQARRSGMAFPKFWRLFFDTLVRDEKPARVIVLKPESGTTWTVPADWNDADNSIEAIGGGGGGGAGNTGSNGGGGGGGGEYRKAANVTFTPGMVVPFSIGAAGSGGAAASTNGGTGGDTVFNTTTLVARGGKGGLSASPGTGGTGGTAGTGGVANFDGGAGGSSKFPNGAAPGGGGAAGPYGVGANAASVDDVGPPTAGGNADNDFGGAGGAAGTSAPTAGGAGGNGGEIGVGVGSGGGGGGGRNIGPSSAGGPGGNYGGGGGGGGAVGTRQSPGGSGAPGVIIISYTP